MMKKLILAISFAILAQVSIAQSIPDFSLIELQKKEDFDEGANNAALKAANYLFSTAILDDNELNRLRCTQYVIRWMSGSPDYSFTIGENIIKFSKKSDNFLGLYMAAMTKYALENKEYSKDQTKIKLNAFKIIIAYVKGIGSDFKINKELKKAIAAEENGTLEDFLK